MLLPLTFTTGLFVCVCAHTYERRFEPVFVFLSYSRIQCSYQVSYLNPFMLTNVDINIVNTVVRSIGEVQILICSWCS